MELTREPDPKPAPPPEATGAFVEKKKVKVLLLMAVAVGLVVASFLTWLLRPRTAPSQQLIGPGIASTNTGIANKKPAKLNESAEEEYEKGRREGLRSNPAFNLNPPDPASNRAPVQPVAVTPKRTPRDAYEDLLAKAAEADSLVEGVRTKNESARNDLSVSDRGTGDHTSTGHDHAVSGFDGGNQKGSREVGANVLPAGTFVYGALVNQLSGENVGPVKVQVSNDVYFPGTLDLAISQGAIFLGEAQKVSAQFQQRLAVTFDRLQITRDGKMYEIALDKIPGLDQQGATALKDKVDSHYLQIFGASLAIGAIGGLAQIGQGSYGGYGGYDTETQIRNGMTQSMAQSASQILNRFLNRPPTVTIRSGTPVVVYIPFGIELQ